MFGLFLGLDRVRLVVIVLTQGAFFPFLRTSLNILPSAQIVGFQGPKTIQSMDFVWDL